MRQSFIFFLCFLFLNSNAQQPISVAEKKNTPMTSFEQNPNTTASYQEAIAFYEKLVKESDLLQLSTHGSTDSGHPLHTIVLSKEKDFNPTSIRKKGKRILLINNAIHPGEPCGVDASMMLLRDYIKDEQLQKKLDHLVIVVIPVYNIGGALNRNSHSRTNQDGPESYGFRGNAKNLDLNRDFIKCDSKNAQTFNQIFNTWQPDVFVDNHTSNGADYQYTMTLIATQHNKLESPLADYLITQMLPKLYTDMEVQNWEMTPYVYARKTPDDGIAGFLDLPRYSSGYAALHNTISFMPETHMLKPYEDRVKSTYAFMDCMIKTIDAHHDAIGTARTKAIEQTKTKSNFDLNWTMDREKVDKVLFKGYEAKYKPSEVSGIDRLYYDHNAPYEKEIPFFNTYKASLSVEKPVAYIIPQAYRELIERLQWNGVEVKRLTQNQSLNVELYRIEDFESSKSPYEGHYLHSKVTIKSKSVLWNYYKGDYIVYTNQNSNRYIIETLEPHAPDSFFAWNFFDGILAQKEYFSPYVFEDLAAQYLKENPALRAQLEAKKKEDAEFAKSAYAQLEFVYKNSPHYEPTHRMYPVARLMSDVNLPAE